MSTVKLKVHPTTTVLPASQVRILNGLYIDRIVGWKQLKRKTVRGTKAVKALRHLNLGKTFVSYLVGRSFATECFCVKHRGELSYLAPLGSENISAPYFKQCFFQGGYTPQTVKHHASQSQDRNNKYCILYIEFCINNKI